MCVCVCVCVCVIPYQKGGGKNRLPLIASSNNFFLFWQDKENVITPAALCNVHFTEWVESSGMERLEFAQMPTAGDEVEAGLRWEVLASTVRAAIRIVLLYDIVE
jgi:hypothetical protein